VEEPPAEGEVPSIRLEVIAVCVLEVVIVVVLQADLRLLWSGCGEGDDAGEIVASSEEV
jgi:hypothetical protein